MAAATGQACGSGDRTSMWQRRPDDVTVYRRSASEVGHRSGSSDGAGRSRLLTKDELRRLRSIFQQTNSILATTKSTQTTNHSTTEPPYASASTRSGLASHNYQLLNLLSTHQPKHATFLLMRLPHPPPHPPSPYMGFGYEDDFYHVVPNIEVENEEELELKEQISNLESFLELEPTPVAAVKMNRC
ncbi:hypothetical protein Ddye_026073 [Dipteronia dyeriana]|uniref:Uncharacterized protein n=1 Tax=Dipteronia dyeriana TaxID=168575 RepID=A0AAD9TLZ8_9ROSI|nr:hypothetical protein Ddye_026073 [Dipteronia dyeriana]